MRILITGGAGYLGTILLEKLIKSSEELNIEKITVYDNLMYKQDGVFPLCSNEIVDFVYGDVRDQNKLKKYLNVDYIFPLAGIVGFPACDRDKRLSRRCKC